MIADKAKENMLENSLSTSLNSSGLQRRKSYSIQNTLPSSLLENNDETERLNRRCEMNSSATLIRHVTTERRHSLGLSFLAQMTSSEITNRICDCIKLNTENKININNAFRVEIIDFMTYMIKKQDANMSNLQVASTSLDVSTKIYGFRVDGVHTEIMKMVGGLDKQEDETSTDVQLNNTNDLQGNEINNREKQKKKKKNQKQKIFSSVDNVKGVVETMKPSIWMMGNEDSQTTDTLYQVMLSNHANSKFYLHLYNDVLVDTVNLQTDTENIDKKDIQGVDFSGLEICPPLANFEFHGWTSEHEKEENERIQPEENNENRFEFDLDADLPSEDETVHSNMNYFDIQDIADNVDNYARTQKPIEKIVDLCKVVTNTRTTKISEYSFLQKNINNYWAGPSHWKISNFQKQAEGSKVIETCHQGPVRKRKEIELSYSNDLQQAVVRKFIRSKATRSDGKTAKREWNEENVSLPQDMHYNITLVGKLNYHEFINVTLEDQDQLNTTHVSDDIQDYNYENENDTSNYCPNVPNDDYGTNEDDANEAELNFEDVETETHVVFTGDNLVAVPKLANKMIIRYDVRPKRIDMRQLKKSIWKALISNNHGEDINIQDTVQQEMENKIKETKNFSEIYKTIPNMLTKTNREALSFPISFVSLLHLANEKTLKVESLPDMSDIVIASN